MLLNNLHSQTFTRYTQINGFPVGGRSAAMINDYVYMGSGGFLKIDVKNNIFTMYTNTIYLNGADTIFPEYENAIWIGRWELNADGIVKFDGENIVNVFNLGTSGLAGGERINDIAINKFSTPNYLWYMNYAAAINNYTHHWLMTNRWLDWESENHLNNPGKIAIDTNGHVWIVSDQGGLIEYDLNFNPTGYFDGAPFDLKSNLLEAIAIDTKDNKWIGYDGETDNVVINKIDSGGTWSGFSSNQCFVGQTRWLMIDNDDRLWICSPEGLSVFDGTNAQLFTQVDGLATGSPECIVQDCNGVYWVGHYSGITKIEFPGRVGLKITGVTPAKGADDGVTGTITINGTGFKEPVKVFLRRNNTNNIAAQNVVRVNSTQITCKFNLSGVATGTWDVAVQNPWRYPLVNYQYELHDSFTVEVPSIAGKSSINESYLFPNVINGERKISIKKMPEKVIINIYDRIGNKLKTAEVTEQNNEIDISDLQLSTGIYFIIAEDIDTGKKKVLKFMFVK